VLRVAVNRGPNFFPVGVVEFSVQSPIVTEHRKLVGPLTIELAQEMPIFKGLTLIRESQLPRELPRQLLSQKGPHMASNWRTARMSLGPTGRTS
jgi:hypothetical protein